VLFWHLLTKEEDYAYAQPSLTRKKLRRLDLLAGAQKGEVKPGMWAANKAMRKAERELAEQAERAYERSVRDWQATRGASATPGRASSRPLGGKQRDRVRGAASQVVSRRVKATLRFVADVADVSPATGDGA
jgi:hypothetical protein